MKQYLIFIGVTLLLSCVNSKDIPAPPTEKCYNISIADLPVLSHGFYPDSYDSVVVESFVKNSKFDTLLNRYIIQLSPVSDKERITRSFNLPKEMTTTLDIKLTFNDSLVYKISEIQTGWVPRWCESFCGYECTVTSFMINDILDNDGGNIFIKEPNFKYPWSN